MRKNHVCLLACSLFLASSAQAVDIGKIDLNLYAGVSRVYLNPGALGFPSGELDTLVPDNTSKTEFLPGFGLSVFFPSKDNSSWLSGYRLGLDMFFQNRSQDGSVLLFGNPGYNYYLYNLKVNTGRLMFAGQLVFTPWKCIYPFVEAAIGGARIDCQYGDKPNPAQGIFDGNMSLASEVQYNFTYSFGLGLSVPFTDRLTGSIGYQFTDMGHVKTSNFAMPQQIVITPIDSRLVSNALYLKLSCTLN